MKQFKYSFACKKVAYMSREYATKVLLENKKSHYGKAKHIYKCPNGEHYHLTSQ